MLIYSPFVRFIMKKKIELKIYELLGIKIFRKIVFGFCKLIASPFTLLLPKEDRKEFLNNLKIINYNIKGYNVQNLRKFKKYLFLNAMFHVSVLLFCLPTFMKVIGGMTSVLQTITSCIVIAINCYCIMLQRYNQIRINETIKRILPYEEKQKTKIKEELKGLENSLSEHTYAIIDKKNNEKEITFNELLQTATLEELKKYRDYLNLARLNIEMYPYVQNGELDLNSKRKKLKIQPKTK